MKLACATLNQTPLDWKSNSANIIQAIKNAKLEHVDLLCLPELCITGYGCEDLFLSTWVYEKALKSLLEIIPHTSNITVSLSLPILFERENYNCACLVSNKKILGFTAKQFLANDGVHYETRWFKPWRANMESTINIHGKTYPFGDVIYDLNDKKIAFEICEDAWHKKRPASRHIEKGVDIIINPSASHFAFRKTFDRQELVENTSYRFKCTYLYANLLGNEAGRMIYDGELLIADQGEIKARNSLFSFKGTNMITHTLGSNESAIAPTLNKNEEFHHATTLALFDYLRKSKAKGYSLSLSGGADSSTCAVMVYLMACRCFYELDPKTLSEKLSFLQNTNSTKDIVNQLLHTAYQGTGNSSDDTFLSAKELAEDIGAQFHSWTIDEEVNSYTSKIEKVLDRKLTWEQDDIALQNIQARSRSPIIWMLTNITGTLLLTTSNRSEGDVGYATMDGDTSGSLAPIAAVDKHFIRQWLLWAEKELGIKGLASVNKLTPTAELRPQEQTQTDEVDLMPYDLLVDIEKLAIKAYQAPIDVFEILKDETAYSEDQLKLYITRFYTLWARNQWKRERIAPAFHLDDFNVDPRTWCRFPILSSGFKVELEELKNA